MHKNVSGLLEDRVCCKIEMNRGDDESGSEEDSGDNGGSFEDPGPPQETW